MSSEKPSITTVLKGSVPPAKKQPATAPEEITRRDFYIASAMQCIAQKWSGDLARGNEHSLRSFCQYSVLLGQLMMDEEERRR